MAEVIQFPCPACGATLRLPLAMAGIHGPCPRCHQEISAPVPASGRSAAILPAAPPIPAEPPAAEEIETNPPPANPPPSSLPPAAAPPARARLYPTSLTSGVTFLSRDPQQEEEKKQDFPLTNHIPEISGCSRAWHYTQAFTPQGRVHTPVAYTHVVWTADNPDSRG